jgi:tetratricopeptide (TPR) repeat protein
MSLQRFIEDWRLTLVASIAFLALGGCASSPEAVSPDAAVGPDGEPLETRVVSPEALSMYEQAVAMMAAGETVEAELRFQEFLLRHPGFPGAHVNLAIIFADRDDFLAAEASLQEALTIDPEHTIALNRLGMVLRRQGRFDEAQSAYEGAVAADPGYALAWYNLGVLNDLYLRRLGDALQNYERYQVLVGEDPQVTKWIADLKRRISAEQRAANVTE